MTPINIAIEALTAEIEKEPQNATLYRERGRLRMMAGDKDGAMADLRQAVQLDPTILEGVEGAFTGDIPSCH